MCRTQVAIWLKLRRTTNYLKHFSFETLYHASYSIAYMTTKARVTKGSEGSRHLPLARGFGCLSKPHDVTNA